MGESACVCVYWSSWVVTVPWSSPRAVEAGVRSSAAKPLHSLPAYPGILQPQRPGSAQSSCLWAKLGPLNGRKQKPKQAFALGMSRRLDSVLAWHLPPGTTPGPWPGTRGRCQVGVLPGKGTIFRGITVSAWSCLGSLRQAAKETCSFS